MMRPVTIRDDELVAVMDALSQYMDNAAVDDEGEPVETPELQAVVRLKDRIEATLVTRLLEIGT
jgi:hypothetical protein